MTAYAGLAGVATKFGGRLICQLESNRRESPYYCYWADMVSCPIPKKGSVVNTTTILRSGLERRGFLANSGKLSAVAIAMLAGSEALAKGMPDNAAQDVGSLNVALGLEHEAINAYQLGAGSGLLDKGVLAVALQFQGHHKAHRDALVGTIRKLGGQPAAE